MAHEEPDLIQVNFNGDTSSLSDEQGFNLRFLLSNYFRLISQKATKEDSGSFHLRLHAKMASWKVAHILLRFCAIICIFPRTLLQSQEISSKSLQNL
jgi:hypothetical protein